MAYQRKHKTSESDIQRIKELSPDHAVDEIARLTNVPLATVIKIQQNPKYAIQDPYRKYYKTRMKKEISLGKMGPDGVEYFDFDAYKELFIY